jgi:hypothetical protein
MNRDHRSSAKDFIPSALNVTVADPQMLLLHLAWMKLTLRLRLGFRLRCRRLLLVVALLLWRHIVYCGVRREFCGLEALSLYYS